MQIEQVAVIDEFCVPVSKTLNTCPVQLLPFAGIVSVQQGAVLSFSEQFGYEAVVVLPLVVTVAVTVQLGRPSLVFCTGPVTQFGAGGSCAILVAMALEVEA